MLEAEPNGEAVARAARERSEQERATTGATTRRCVNPRSLSCIGRAAVVTPPSTGRHVNRGGTRVQQRSGSRPERSTRRQHIVHQQDATARHSGTGNEARPGEPLSPSSARLHSSADPAQQPPRTPSQRLASGSRQHLRLVEPPRPPMRRRRRRPRHQLDRYRPRTRAFARRGKVSQRQRVSQPASNSPLAPVLQRMDELAPHPVMGEQQRRRDGTRHHRRLRISKCLNTSGTGAPPQRPAPRTANLEQHAPDRRCPASLRRRDFLRQ